MLQHAVALGFFSLKNKKVIAKQMEQGFFLYIYIEVKSDLWLGKTIGDYLSLMFTRAVISGLFILKQSVAELTVKSLPYKMCNGLEMLFF